MDVITILNTIRANGSQTYKERIPEATRTNIESIRFAMLDSDNVQVANEFMSTLLNKCLKSVIHSKVFNNPLKAFKSGQKPVGDTVEEIFTNFIKGDAYDKNGTNLLARKLPDTKTVYHRMNYQHMYKVTVSYEALSRAFASYDALDSYISGILNMLYNSAELDEFINMKQLIKSALDKNAMKVVDIVDPATSKEAAAQFIKDVKKVSGLMAYPSKDWNAYLTAQSKDKTPIETFTSKDEQILILDTSTEVDVNVDVLATVFNKSVAEFNDTTKVVIDYFPVEGVRAALVDKNFFQVFDDIFTFKAFENAEGLYTNYYLHVWQTYAYSILVNAVAFKLKAAAEG